MKENNFYHNLNKYFLSKSKSSIFVAMFLSFIGGLLLAYGPKKLGDITTFIHQGIVSKMYGTGGIDYVQISSKLLTTALIYICAIAIIIISQNAITTILQKKLKDLKVLVAKKITRLKLSTIENKIENKNITNIYNEFDALNKYLSILFNQLILVISIVLGSIYFMCRTSIILLAIELFLFPTLIIMLKIVSKRYNKNVKNSIKQEENFEDFLAEAVYRKRIINIFNCKNAILNNFSNLNKINQKTNASNKKTIMHIESFSSLIGNTNLLVILVIGSYLNIIGEINLGDIQSFLLYSKLIERPIYIASKISNIFYLIKNSLNKISYFLSLEEEENTGTQEFVDGDITLENVSFKYDDINVLNNINLDIKKGSKIAIVGKTGSGKTTLLKLLLQYYKSYDGQISINGIDIKDIDIASLRKNIALVPQNNWIFNGTIKENIQYGNEPLTEEQMIEVSKVVRLHDFIETLPKKYNTRITENSTELSLGQKQLICIARMILRDAPIVLLDEATNLIDYDTELAILNALDEFLKDKTCIIIAHRLSTIVKSDKIIVFDSGKILEEGTHAQLLELNGKYKEMYIKF